MDVNQLARLVCFGFVRNHLKHIEINNICHIILDYLLSTMNKIDWKFDYVYDYLNREWTNKHGIHNNGKTLKCNIGGYCHCFYCSYSIGMKPNSGKYSIKIKINHIGSDVTDVIGIVSQYSKKHELVKNNFVATRNPNGHDQDNKIWSRELEDCLGWSACPNFHNWLPNGLFCGCNDFRLRKPDFVYKSGNKYYTGRLPGLYKGDVIRLLYNSDLNTLSFFKENDNGTLNAFVSNLPKNTTFYWFVGHACGKMSMTIVD